MKTIHDIAALAGCSARTVSRVLNESGPVAEATKAKVLSISKAHQYQPNLQAKNLRTGKKKCIGLIQSTSDSEVHRHRIETMTGLFSSADYALLINRARNEMHEVELVDQMAPQCDALVIFTSLSCERQASLDRLMRMGYPFFMIDPAQNMPYPKVEVGRRQAFREGTMALADKGRRRIALVTQNFRRQERLVGYREGLELSGLQEDSELIFHCERGFEGGRVVGAQLSARVRAGEIDGLLCHNDRIALGIMQQLHRHGIVIPRDVSIVGFDNDAYGAFTTPSLSTMEQGRQDVGVYIYEQIHGNLEKGLSLQNRHFNAHLIIRESI